MYVLPGNIRVTARSQWVWELQKCLEESHWIVREPVIIFEVMPRQKTHHDQKLRYEN